MVKKQGNHFFKLTFRYSFRVPKSMTMKKTVLLAIVFFLYIQPAVSQDNEFVPDYFPVSPQAASLGKYLDLPVQSLRLFYANLSLIRECTDNDREEVLRPLSTT